MQKSWLYKNGVTYIFEPSDRKLNFFFTSSTGQTEFRKWLFWLRENYYNTFVLTIHSEGNMTDATIRFYQPEVMMLFKLTWL